MSTDNALLEFEGGQNAFPMTELTDTGDAQLFESGEELWSQAAGFAPVVRPDGVVTGAEITPASGNDSVAVAAFTAFVGGGVSGFRVSRPRIHRHSPDHQYCVQQHRHCERRGGH